MSFTTAQFYKPKEKSVYDLFPASNKDFIQRAAKLASCIPGIDFTSAFFHYVLEGGLPISITKQIEDGDDPWVFDVVHGRSGTIATATDGVAIDAGSTISIQYTLVESPGANDWVEYEDGLFTGAHVNKIIEFAGLQNRVVWTANAGESLNVMVAL
jgi:hypothetical protein